MEEILNPTVFYQGWEIREPVTSATDLLTGVVSLFAFIYLGMMKSISPIVGQMRAYFILMAISMGFAGIAGHAMQAYISWEWKMIGWSFGAMAVCMLEQASITALQDKLGDKYSLWLRIFAVLHLIIFFIAIAIPATRSFSAVKINSTIGLVGLVLPLHAYNLLSQKVKSSFWIVLAMIWALIPAYVYNMEVSISRWFNFHDISHVLMSIYTVYLFLGAKSFARNFQN
ncbi:MAG: hypothetical protein AAF696_12310 [Bacteroidota bacterium]